jgi:hypothetical protein
VAANSILDRAFGEPGFVKEEKDDLEIRAKNMTGEERLGRMPELLGGMRQYLHGLDEPVADDEAEVEVGAVEVDRPRGRRSAMA